MPEKKVGRNIQAATSPSTQAGEFVREEIEDVRAGKHGARSAKQVIAIGLAKARRAGVKLPPAPGKDVPKGTGHAPNPRRSRAAHEALEREGTSAASHQALSRQARASARQRGPASLRAAARKAANTRARKGRHSTV
jgi:hypothetical protein